MAKQWQSPPQGSPCWIEIPAKGNPKALQSFYAEVFPSWQWRSPNEDEHDQKVIHYKLPNVMDGGIVRTAEDTTSSGQQIKPNGMTVYYLVDDLGKSKEAVHAAGGTTCTETTSDSDFAEFVGFQDPQGIRFAVYQVKK